MDIMTSVGLVSGIHRHRGDGAHGRRSAHVRLRTCHDHHLRRVDRRHHDPLSAWRDAARPAARREIRLHHEPAVGARPRRRTRPHRRNRPQAGTGRPGKGRDRRTVPRQGNSLRRRRLRSRIHPRQSRARPRQFPDASRRGQQDLPRHRRLRAGVRHDRNPDRHGADVRQHDRPLQARPVHGDRAAGDAVRRAGREPVLSCRSPTSCTASCWTRKPTAR